MIERAAIIARGAKARQPGIGHWEVGVEAAVGRLQARLQDLADARVAAGAEVGLQIAVFHRGTLVADVAAGLADPASGRRVDGDTLFFAASTAKAIASTVAHVLIDHGALRDDDRLADWWPAFAAHGKDVITVRHILTHTAGVPAVPADTTVSDLHDWDHMTAALEAAEPWWAPGTRLGYHAVTFGYLLGEYIRRRTGQTIAAALREHVTGPLGVADDVHFAVPADALGRVATQVPAATPPPSPAPDSAADRALPAAIRPDAAYANRRDVLTAPDPSSGTMTARGAATVLAALLDDGAGNGLVSPQRLRQLAEITFTGHDEVIGMDATWAYGYAPFRPGHDGGRPGSTFGMVGMNGSVAYADIETGVATAVMRNRFDPTDLTTAAAADDLTADACRPDDARAS